MYERRRQSTAALGTFVPICMARGVVCPDDGRVGVDCGDIGRTVRRDAAADDAGEAGIPGERPELHASIRAACDRRQQEHDTCAHASM